MTTLAACCGQRRRAFAAFLACVAALAAPVAARADSSYAQTVSWLLRNYARDFAPAYPERIAISGCDLAVTGRPDRKTEVTTHVDLRASQVSFYAGPGLPHVDFLTAAAYAVRFRYADGSTATGRTAAAVLGTRNGQQAVRIAGRFDRLRALCAAG